MIEIDIENEITKKKDKINSDIIERKLEYL